MRYKVLNTFDNPVPEDLCSDPRRVAVFLLRDDS